MGVLLPTRAPMRQAAPWPSTTPGGTSMRGDDRWTSIRIEGRPLGQLAGHRACQWPPWTVSHIRSSPGLAALLDDQRAPHAGGLVARDLADDGVGARLYLGYVERAVFAGFDHVRCGAVDGQVVGDRTFVGEVEDRACVDSQVVRSEREVLEGHVEIGRAQV